MIRALLVDDEEPARMRLRSLLAPLAGLSVVGEARDGEEAVRLVGELRPDLLFLDIEMPGLDGMQVAASLPPPRPRIIFCTAFDHYAIEAFEHHALDYLLKPLHPDRLSRAVARAQRALDEQRQRDRELGAASETQARLLPQAAPAFRGLDCAGRCRPAGSVGGDYYDFLRVGPTRLALVLADVSGKGLFAGLLMASLQARVQALAPRYGVRIAPMLGELNRLVHGSTSTNRYATLFYAVFDDATRTLSYVSAGHPPPIVVRGKQDPGSGGDPATLRLAAGGTAVGLLSEAAYRETRLELRAGDLLVAFSDGVTEAADAGGEELGEGRLVDLVLEHRELPAARLVERIVESVDRFRGAAPAADDLTLLVGKVR